MLTFTRRSSNFWSSGFHGEIDSLRHAINVCLGQEFISLFLKRKTVSFLWENFQIWCLRSWKTWTLVLQNSLCFTKLDVLCCSAAESTSFSLKCCMIISAWCEKPCLRRRFQGLRKNFSVWGGDFRAGLRSLFLLRLWALACAPQIFSLSFQAPSFS